MIVINLLPPSARRRRSSLQAPPKLVLAACGAAVGAAVVAVVVCFMLILTARSQLRSAQDELAALAPQRGEAEQLRSIRDDLAERAKLVEQLVAGRVSWAQILSRVADLLPDEIWLTEIRLEERQETVPAKNAQDKPKVVVKKSLIIRGVAVAPKTGGELNSVAVFMERLRDDEEFAKQFTGVRQDGAIEWDPDLGQSVFQLRCDMREGA